VSSMPTVSSLSDKVGYGRIVASCFEPRNSDYHVGTIAYVVARSSRPMIAKGAGSPYSRGAA